MMVSIKIVTDSIRLLKKSVPILRLLIVMVVVCQELAWVMVTATMELSVQWCLRRFVL